MLAQRESFYRCTFESEWSRRTAHVRAWDPGEAVQLFCSELRTEGVEERGTIEVTDFEGAVAKKASYRP